MKNLRDYLLPRITKIEIADQIYDVGNDISNLAHEQNEKVMKEEMKKEIINELKETGAETAYLEDLEYDSLEKILNENK